MWVKFSKKLYMKLYCPYYFKIKYENRAYNLLENSNSLKIWPEKCCIPLEVYLFDLFLFYSL